MTFALSSSRLEGYIPTPEQMASIERYMSGDIEEFDELMDRDMHKIPEKTMDDAAHAVVRACLSAIPVLGGASAELFQQLIQPPLDKRRQEWIHSVGERLAKLEHSGITLEALQSNEQFISAVMHASNMALRTHKESKIEALQNAILNVAKGQAPDETVQYLFFGLLDSLTEMHIRILKLFQAPTPPPSMSMGGLIDVLEYNIHDLGGRQDLSFQLWKDLHSRGLVNTEGLGGTISGRGLSEKRTTGFGDEFIEFISEA